MDDESGWFLCFWIPALRSFRDDEDDSEATPLKRRTSSRRQKSKRYGISISTKETIHERYLRRQKLCEQRLKISDWCVYLALAGLGLGVIDVEYSVAIFGRSEMANEQSVPGEFVSHFIRILIIFLTFALDFLVFCHHWTEVAILSADTGHQVIGMSIKRKLKLCLELMICSLCPFPGHLHVDWPVLNQSIIMNKRAHIPLNVLLTVPMFLRLYLVGRNMIYHSMIIQDAATRAIASFNRVSVDFPFVLKSIICDRPLTFVVTVSLTFWGCASWIMTQCERYASGNLYNTIHYLSDYAWFEAVTFFAIGYGDLQVQTYCGRSLAILTGVVGAIFSSLITVLLSQKMLLSLAEKRVNQVIAESQLANNHKNAAAIVLQSTWRVVRWQRRVEYQKNASKKDLFHLRLAQRNLLQSVVNFRKCRWKLRMRQEEEDDAITIRRAFTETEERLRMLRARQQQVASHLQGLCSKVDRLSRQCTRHYGTPGYSNPRPKTPQSNGYYREETGLAV
ncbi:unnamed protein product [Bursaphelenchus okinawaensis]|uniref:Calmodulin-binding domain-containing protein n=1 Tax=Bursaphelenchus okinawaensis TaxID=465554 RepID=A0A811L9E7_9BILA|nr:unnamed protein product [Bursaphelenchus okinawaensis]CAG9120250.1 unnamed protein product [Bursaphelenchus okinawaensis]